MLLFLAVTLLPADVFGNNVEVTVTQVEAPATLQKEASATEEIAFVTQQEVPVTQNATTDTNDMSEDSIEAIQSAVHSSWYSILPPVAAITIALIFKQVLLALFIGIWMGAWMIHGATIAGLFISFFTTGNEYIVPSIADPDHVSILVFSLLIGGMVGIIGANGGTRGIIQSITRLVTSRQKAQITTTALGYIVFFDDYANTMIVGSTMRPLMDRLRISRAKLAYLVDSTAAPIAIIALISTWIGAVVGYIREAESAIPEFTESAYLIFLNSLPYNFYAFLAIIFVAIIAVSGRDFGPMRRFEQLAFDGEDTSGITDSYDENEQKEFVSHWMNAVLPILGLVLVTLSGLWFTGEGSSLQEVIGSADSYASLVWGSLFSLFIASALTIGQKLISIDVMMKGMLRGMHLMFEGLIILVLAWSLGMVTQQLGTADYLVSLLEGVLNPYWIPVLILVLAAFTSFATGSSWGTMGILMPLVLPLAWSLSASAGLDTATAQMLIYASVSSVLAGSVWGDHCSPISDTTILSSLASRCDHISHVNSQLPYAMVVGGLSILSLAATVVTGITVWVVYPVAIAIMITVVYRFGRPVS